MISVIKENMYIKPRKVRIGTVIFDTYQTYPGLDQRKRQLSSLIELVVHEGIKRFGSSGLDIIVLPEDCLGRKSDVPGDVAFRLDSSLSDWIGTLARNAHSWLLFPLLRIGSSGNIYNSALLYDRDGKLFGTYDKIHPVLDKDKNSFEGGVHPGERVPVFNCDFGKIGIQICFDMDFEDGWDLLREQGAEIVLWPSESPQTIRPSWRALQGNCYIVSATTRENATIFSPVGFVHSQIVEPSMVLVDEIDLSYARLNFSHPLENGKAISKRFGDKVAYRYSEIEDMGLFWSEDASLSIGEMLEELSLLDDLDMMVKKNHQALEPFRPLKKE